VTSMRVGRIACQHRTQIDTQPGRAGKIGRISSAGAQAQGRINLPRVDQPALTPRDDGHDSVGIVLNA
jgi:hypothetical protein